MHRISQVPFLLIPRRKHFFEFVVGIVRDHHLRFAFRYLIAEVLMIERTMHVTFPSIQERVNVIGTVNQAGAIGAVGALIMAGYRLTSDKKGCFYPSIIAILSIIFIGVVTSIYTVNIRSVQTNDDVIGVILAVIGTIGLLLAIGWSAWRAFKIDDTLNMVMLETAKTT